MKDQHGVPSVYEVLSDLTNDDAVNCISVSGCEDQSYRLKLKEFHTVLTVQQASPVMGVSNVMFLYSRTRPV